MSDEEEPELVIGNDPAERINRAISLPTILKSPDGRLFEIRSWNPLVLFDSAVSIKLDVVVRMPDSPE